MGNLGEGQTDTLDERMWGDDDDEEEEEGSDKEEESGQGMDQVQKTSFYYMKNISLERKHIVKGNRYLKQSKLCSFHQGESELVAKDDNLDAADPSKDNKKQDKEEHVEDEEKEKIHEQGDEVIFINKERGLRILFPTQSLFYF